MPNLAWSPFLLGSLSDFSHNAVMCQTSIILKPRDSDIALYKFADAIWFNMMSRYAP